MISCGPDAALGQVLLIYGHIQDTQSATRSRATVGCNNNTAKSCSSPLYQTWKVNAVSKILSKVKVISILAPITYAMDYFYESTLEYMNYIIKEACKAL